METLIPCIICGAVVAYCISWLYTEYRIRRSQHQTNNDYESEVKAVILCRLNELIASKARRSRRNLVRSKYRLRKKYK